MSLVAANSEGLSRRSNLKRGSKSDGSGPSVNVVAGQNVMSTIELKLMGPLLRLLQLFCENHNSDMQVELQCITISCDLLFYRITLDIKLIVKTVEI